MRLIRFLSIITPAIALALLSSPGQAEITGEEIDYSVGGTTFKGYLAYDSANSGKRPGVLVVHEWWGHNDYVRERADMLAELGYTALALDMYGDGKLAEHPQDAGKFAKEVMSNMDTMQKRFEAALQQLKAHASVKADDIAAIGYCFGGGVVLNMARSGLDIDGVASFHGSLGAAIKPEAGDVKARILVLHGGGDKFISADQVADFNKEMIEAGADYKFVSYPGVLHGFTSKEADKKAEEFGIPLAYDAHADQHSWAEMQTFFEELFTN